MNECAACSVDFASLAAFDRHRVGVPDYTFAEGLRREPPRDDGRRCLHVSELADVGLELDPRGRWRIAGDAERVREYFKWAA